MKSFELMGYVIGRHFEDSKKFFNARARHKIIPEQPLFRTSWIFKDGTYRPYYEIQNAPGADQSEFWSSLSEAREGRGEIGDLIASEDNSPISIPTLYRTYQNRKIAKDKEEAEARLSAALLYLEQKGQKGVVYKNSDFWKQFTQLETARLIFDGEFQRIKDPVEVASIYISFVSAFYDVCEKYLSPHAMERRRYNLVTGEDVGLILKADPQFVPAYDNLQRIAKAGSVSGILKAFGNYITIGRQPTFQDIRKLLGDATKSATRQIKYEASLERLMSLPQSSCDSATVKQLGVNLVAFTGGRPPVQVAGTEHKSEYNESSPVIQADIDREMTLRKQEQEDNILRLAAAPVPSPDGWPLAHEELEPYWVIKFGNDEAYRSRTDYRTAINNLQKRSQPVITCRYGPTGLNGKLPTWRTWIFWYDHIPPETSEIMNVDGKNQPGLAISIRECPQSTSVLSKLLQES